MDAKAKNLIIENISLFKDLSEKFKYYQVEKIDQTRIIYFISQFDTYERIKIVIELLKNIDFIDSSRMTFLLKLAYEKIPKELLEKPLISSLGSIQDSSAVVCYQLLKQLFDKEEDTLNQIAEVNSIGKHILIDDPTAIIFFDDNITSGTQLYEFFTELIVGKENAELVKTPLTSTEYEKLKKIPIRICYAVQLTEECFDIVNNIRNEYKLDIGIYCGKVDFNNYLNYQSNTMQSEEDAKFARNFIREIVEPLFEDKKWSENTIYHRLLGYGNLGKLTIFYYNVPKSLIPIFWKYGYYNNQPWIPLFPETQEQKKILKDAVGFDYFRLEAINSWINSLNHNRKPDISFGIYFEGDMLNDISIEIPSKKTIFNYLRNFSPSKKTYKPNQIAVINDINSMLYETFSSKATKLNESEYEKYKNAIDKYNLELEDYYNEVKQYIFRQSSEIEIYLQVKNSGNIAATNCTIKILYNTGDLVINFFDELPKPEFKKELPNINDFNSSDTIRIVRAVMPSIEFAQIKPRHEPILLNKNYEFRLVGGKRIGHNDFQREIVEISRYNLNKNIFQIPYELNFDEEAETIKGILTINLVEVDEIKPETEEKIKKSIRKFEIK